MVQLKEKYPQNLKRGIGGFNSSMVQLKVINDQAIDAYKLVSIPLWYN